MKDRAYKIARNHKYDRYQRVLASMVYRFFDKKTGSGVIETSKVGVILNEKLTEELHKPEIKKLKRRKVYARFKIESLSSENRNVKYLSCVTDVFTKYAWVEPLKDKKDKTVLNAFIKVVSESNYKLVSIPPVPTPISIEWWVVGKCISRNFCIKVKTKLNQLFFC